MAKSYLVQTGQARCLSTSLPLLGSLATRFLSAIAPSWDYSK